MQRPTKALSIMQPWPWYILRPDITDPAQREWLYENAAIKDVENRDWRSANPGLKFRGPVLIHAGKRLDPQFHWPWARTTPLPARETLDRGGIVGMAEIVDTVSEYDSPWFSGPVGLVLRNARPLPFMPLKGQLGFFNADYDWSLLS